MTDFATIVADSGFEPPETKHELLEEAASLPVGLRKAAEVIYERYYVGKPNVVGDDRVTRIDNLRKMIRKVRKERRFE